MASSAFLRWIKLRRWSQYGGVVRTGPWYIECGAFVKRVGVMVGVGLQAGTY